MKELIPKHPPAEHDEDTTGKVVSAQFRPLNSRSGRRSHQRKHAANDPFIVLWDEMDTISHDHY